MKYLRPYALAPAVLSSALFVLMLLSPQAIAQSSNQTAPDNSSQNKNQLNNADNQSNATADRQTTAQIRKAIVADKSLSTYAHNVKIITVNGAVTLKGPVSSEDEKQKVIADASSVVSADKLTDKLTVKQ
jgi:osmotically-inducible protein OsmY